MIAVLTFIFTIICIKTISHLTNNLPSINKFDDHFPKLSTKIYDRNNNVISEFFTERRILVQMKEVPPYLQNAFIAIEDNDFFEHRGISVKGIVRAFLKMLINGKIVEGGSTITQQLAKTVFLTNKKTLTRKIKELLLTIQIENKYSKNEILQFYMNQIYFGNGAYGVQAASRTYFDKNVQDLNLAECAMLAAIPKSPNYYNPFKNKKAISIRKNLVLLKMKKLGYITKNQEHAARIMKLQLKKTRPNENIRYFLELLKIELEPKYGLDTLFEGGLSIYTTLDINAQAIAEKTIENALAKFDEQQNIISKKIKLKENYKKVQGALISIDPKDGAIIAMVGGRNFKESQFNRATQAKRQAGSLFKPFVYMTAIDAGFTPATMLNDESIVLINRNNIWELNSKESINSDNELKKHSTNMNKIWTPENYGKKYRGQVTLRTALSSSINTCAIEMIMKITPAKVIKIARDLGITTDLTNSPSLALGSSEVTLQEITSAFAVFASGGIRSKPYIITKIIDRNGKILEQNIPQQKEVISIQKCFIMTNMLRSVIEKGSGKNAKSLGRPCAGKTGTTNNSSDVWFVGYTPQLVTGVWVGYDDSSISLGKNVTGSIIACPIWTEFTKKTLYKDPVMDFSQPDGIEWALVDQKTGLLSLNNETQDDFLDAFISGTAPKKYCNNVKLLKKNNINEIEKDF
jgi:penicillin-binding protein 1A